MAAVTLDTPLAEALNTAVHSRIVEEGWTQEDDTALAEYIVLMLANGKTQEQVASELAGELLQDAQGTEEFSRWLFEQVTTMANGGTASAAPAAEMQDQSSSEAMDAESSVPAAYEADMGDNAPDNAYVLPHRFARRSNMIVSPKGPRGLHGGRAGRGGRGGITKPSDSALHRTRGNDRIGSHVRGAPKGPRGMSQSIRPGMQKALNGLAGSSPQQSPNPMMQQNGMPPGPGQQMPMAFSPEQQMQYLAMMEQQARLMAQWNEMQQGMGGSPNGGVHNSRGGSLFDRVERGRGGGRGRGRGAMQQNGSTRSPSTATGDVKAEGEDGASAMDTDQASKFQQQSNDPFSVMCHWNLQCTNKSCIYAHQSSAAPMHIAVDMTQTCNFGAACSKPTCVARHPSPAQRKAHQAEELCKFFPNCSKPNCPFKHPTMPLCTWGASCTNAACKFTHLEVACRFNPCTNAKCPYKHAPGQNRTINDYTWTPESAKQKEEQNMKHTVSDRQFVDQTAGEEELIKPEPETGGAAVEANGGGEEGIE